MSADDEEHSESEFYYSTEDITLPSIDRNDALFSGGILIYEGGIKKNKNIIYRYGRSV